MVRTPWEYAIWLYEASEQNVGGGELSGVGDTPQTVMTTRAPAVLKICSEMVTLGALLETMAKINRKCLSPGIAFIQ